MPLLVFAVWAGVYPNTFLAFLHVPGAEVSTASLPSLAQHGTSLAQLAHFTKGLL